MLGKRYKGAIVTMVDRKSKFLLALPAARKSAEEVSKA